jgi:hypothetical protein
MKMTERKRYQQSKRNVKGAATTKRYGGCFRQDLQMSRQRNFIDVQNARTLGATIHKK